MLKWWLGTYFFFSCPSAFLHQSFGLHKGENLLSWPEHRHSTDNVGRGDVDPWERCSVSFHLWLNITCVALASLTGCEESVQVEDKQQ